MKIKLKGTFFNNHSLSIVNRNAMIELSKYAQVLIEPLDLPTVESKVSKEAIEKLLGLTGTNIGTPDIELRHSYPPNWAWPEDNSTKVVYIQPWEYTNIPSEWQYKFDTFADAVISPSSWNTNVYREAGIDPNKLFTVPNGYDPTIFNEEGRTESEVTTVLFVGCNQFRKGLDILLSVWSQVTKKSDKIKLVIKDMPVIYGETNLLDEITRLQYKHKCAKIEYIDSQLSELEMADLYKSANILIHPYRGEGFGMHIQEAIACGCIPLVTAGGPTDEFVTNFKINASPRVVDMYSIFALKPTDSMSSMGSHKFVMEPDAQHLAIQLKHIVDNLSTIIVNKSKLQTWEDVGLQYFEVLKKVGMPKTLPRRILK